MEKMIQWVLAATIVCGTSMLTASGDTVGVKKGFEQ